MRLLGINRFFPEKNRREGGGNSRKQQLPFFLRTQAIMAKNPESCAALFEQGRALIWVIENWRPIVAGFQSKNMKGVSAHLGPDGQRWEPPFGAVGLSGRKYYFIPPEYLDGFVDASPAVWADDGLGGPACGANWARFSGGAENILNKFLDALKREGFPDQPRLAVSESKGLPNMEMLRQN